MLKINRVSWALSALLALTACDEEEQAATAVVVSVKHDLGAQLSGLRVRVYPVNADFRNPATPAVAQSDIPAAGLAKPIVITKGGADDLLLVVRGVNPAGTEFIEHAVRARFQSGKSLAVPVFLGARCNGIACAGTGDTCYGQPGDTQCGACGPITLVLGQEIESAGEEAKWEPKSCVTTQPEGGLPDVITPPPVQYDGGDGGGDGGDGGRDGGDGAIAPPCMPPANSPCSIAPLCGCAPGEGCSLDLPVVDLNAPTFFCEDRGTSRLNMLCKGDMDCAPGFECLYYGVRGYCYPDCRSKADCTAPADCSPVNIAGKRVNGVGTCQTSCSTNAECPDGCCNNGTCNPKEVCHRDGTSCMKDLECPGSNSSLGGQCLFSRQDDGGLPSVGTCYSKCNAPSDCETDCCYRNATTGLSFCDQRENFSTEGQAAFCTPP